MAYHAHEQMRTSCVCFHMYIYIYTQHTYIYTHTCIHMCICDNPCTWANITKHTYIHATNPIVWASLCMYVCMHTYTHMHNTMYIYIYVYMYTHVCAYIHRHVYTHEIASLTVQKLYAPVRVCMYVCIHTHTYMCVCVCIQAITHEHTRPDEAYEYAYLTTYMYA